MDVHCSEVDSELPRFFHNEVSHVSQLNTYILARLTQT